MGRRPHGAWFALAGAFVVAGGVAYWRSSLAPSPSTAASTRVPGATGSASPADVDDPTEDDGRDWSPRTLGQLVPVQLEAVRLFDPHDPDHVALLAPGARQTVVDRASRCLPTGPDAPCAKVLLVLTLAAENRARHGILASGHFVVPRPEDDPGVVTHPVHERRWLLTLVTRPLPVGATRRWNTLEWGPAWAPERDYPSFDVAWTVSRAKLDDGNTLHGPSPHIGRAR